MVLKASLNVNLSPKPGDACVYIEAGGCAAGAPPATPPPRRAHKAGGVVRGRRPERVSARRRPPRPGRPPPAPAARPGPTCSRRRIKLSSPFASSSFSPASRWSRHLQTGEMTHTRAHGAHSHCARLAAGLLPSPFSSLPGPRPPPPASGSPAWAVSPAAEDSARPPLE